MKRIIMFVLLFAALKVAGQTTGYLRFDTVKIMKQNGTCELYIINKTKDSLGLLTNVGGGLTQFKRARAINDSSIIIGNDTITIGGGKFRFGVEDNISTQNRSHEQNRFYFSLLDQSTQTLKLDPANGAYQIGKNNSNGAYLSLDTTTNSWVLQAGNANYLSMNAPTNLFEAIMQGGFSFLQLDADNSVYKIGDLSTFGSGNNTYLQIDDGNLKTTLNKQFRLSDYGGSTYEATDTTSYKPLVVDASGNVSKMGGWPGAGAAPQVQNSITGDGSSGDKLRLVNDVSAPGNDYYYGTNYSGTRNWVQPDVGWYNLIKAGADNTGAIDVSTYVTAAQAAGRRDIYLPKGYYKISSTVQMLDSVTIRGDGRQNTIIVLTSNITAFNLSNALGGKKCQFIDIGFQGTNGSGGNSSQRAIVADSVTGVYIHNCGAYFLGGYFATFKNNGLLAPNAFSFGNIVSDCYGETNGGGVLLDVRSEYNTVQGCTFADGNYGVRVSGGNNRIIGNNLSTNAYNLYLEGGGNNGHGTAVGNILNHAGTSNVYATSVTLGFNLEGNMIYSGNITLLNSDAIVFNGGAIEVSTITVTSCTKTNFVGVRWSTEPTWTITGNAPGIFKYDESTTSGFTLRDPANNKDFKIYNNNGVVHIGGSTNQQMIFDKPIVGAAGTYDATRDLCVGKVRVDLGSTTGDGVQIYKTGSSGSALAVLDNSANYLLYAHPTGWVGVGNNSTRTSTEVFKVVGGAAFNLGSDATGDIFYRNSGGLFTRLGIGSSGQFLQVNTGLPSWQSTLAVANGGTGNTSLTAYALLAGGTTSTGAMQQVSGLGTSGQALVSTGSGALPTWQNISRTIDVQFTTASNSGTSETDLFTKTVAANTLTANGQTLNFEIDGEVNDNTATAQIKLYFAGNTTLNTGAINISTANTAWKIKGMVVRTSPTTAHVTYELDALGLATPKFLGYSNLTSLDFTTTNIFKVTAQAGGAGGGNGDITAHSWQVLYKPEQ